MKHLLPVVGLLLALSPIVARAQVGVGTTSPDAKAALDIRAIDKGLLIPRLTAGQRTGIATPPQGLMVYQTDGTAGGGAQAGFWYYAGTGGWVFINPASTADNLGNHTATQNLNLATSQLVGNGGSTGLAITSGGNVGFGTTAALTRLTISPSVVEPKITLWDGGSATNHYGFGVSGGQLNYHVGSTSDNHVFWAGGKNGDGTELARLTGAGRLGIGVAGPTATLDVVRGTATNGTAIFRGTDRISHFSYGTTEDTYLRGGKNTANVLLNDNGGRVGVGTTAPFSMLANTTTNVVGADGYGVGEKSLTWSSNIQGYAGAIFNANPGVGQNGLAVKVAGANPAANALDVSQGLAGSVGASLLTVRANGYVGLGTANPNATLEVRRGTAGDGTAAFYGTARISHFNYSTAEDTYIRGGKAASNVYINDSGGNVGVGTASAPQRLTVAGTAQANNNSNSTAAVIGANANPGSFAPGVQGTTAGSGRGVDGFALIGTGVYGETESGYAMQAIVSNTGVNNGWALKAQATDGVGVRAIATTGKALWASAAGTEPAALITQTGTGLALDVTGGAVRTTEVRTPSTGSSNMLALAYGNISSGGVPQFGSSENISCTHPSIGLYYITVAGETLASSGFMTMVQLTGTSTGDPLYFQAVGGKLLVQVNGGAGGALSNASFNFIIYKP